MASCRFEGPIPSHLEGYHFRVRGGIWNSHRGAMQRFNYFMANLVPQSKLSVTQIAYDSDTGLAFVKLDAGQPRRQTVQWLRHLCWSIANPKNRVYIEKLSNQSILGISPVNAFTLTLWREAVFRSALDAGPAYLESIGALMSTCHYIPDWAICLMFSIVAGINLAAYKVTPSRESVPLDLNSQSGVRVDHKLESIFGPRGRAVASATLSGVIERNTSRLLTVVDQFQSIKELFQKILDCIARFQVDNVSRRPWRVSYQKATIAAYRATLILAKSLLCDKDSFEAFVATRKGANVDGFEPLESLSALVGTGGVASDFTTESAPVSAGAFWSFITGAGWPKIVVCKNNWALLVGGSAITGVIYGRPKVTEDEDMITPDRQFCSVLSYCCGVLNEANLFTICREYLTTNATPEATTRYINAVGIDAIRDQWQRFIEQDGAKAGSARARQIRRYVRDRLSEEETTIRTSLGDIVHPTVDNDESDIEEEPGNSDSN